MRTGRLIEPLCALTYQMETYAMPQFILDTGSLDGARTFNALDSFAQGYVEAMFFTSTGSGDDGDLQHATVAELSPEALASIVRDCDLFQLENVGALEEAFNLDGVTYDEEAAGRDYWYTRNGHGTGFWDRGLGEVGDRLAEAAGFDQVDPYRGDDGLIYL